MFTYECIQVKSHTAANTPDVVKRLAIQVVWLGIGERIQASDRTSAKIPRAKRRLLDERR